MLVNYFWKGGKGGYRSFFYVSSTAGNAVNHYQREDLA
jgi:hypothetical protein